MLGRQLYIILKQDSDRKCSERTNINRRHLWTILFSDIGCSSNNTFNLFALETSTRARNIRYGFGPFDNIRSQWIKHAKREGWKLCHVLISLILKLNLICNMHAIEIRWPLKMTPLVNAVGFDSIRFQFTSVEYTHFHKSRLPDNISHEKGTVDVVYFGCPFCLVYDFQCDIFKARLSCFPFIKVPSRNK